MLTRTALLAAALVTVAAGCSAGDPAPEPTPTPGGTLTSETVSPETQPSEGPSEGPSEASTAEPTRPTVGPAYLPVPEGVELTAQGSDLAFGDAATLAWQPPAREGAVGVLRARVDRVERTTVKDFADFRLTPAQRRATPFYVRVRVENAGETGLGGVLVPLYADTGRALVQATPIPVRFAPCQPGTLPDRFPSGAKADVCLVYLLPQGSRFRGVTFRPQEAFDPITWTGEVSRP